MSCSDWFVERKKKIIKTISWRIISTSITFIISYLVQGDVDDAAIFATIDTVLKTVLYYIHEGQCDKLDKKGYCSVEVEDNENHLQEITV